MQRKQSLQAVQSSRDKAKNAMKEHHNQQISAYQRLAKANARNDDYVPGRIAAWGAGPPESTSSIPQSTHQKQKSKGKFNRMGGGYGVSSFVDPKKIGKLTRQNAFRRQRMESHQRDELIQQQAGKIKRQQLEMEKFRARKEEQFHEAIKKKDVVKRSRSNAGSTKHRYRGSRGNSSQADDLPVDDDRQTLHNKNRAPILTPDEVRKSRTFDQATLPTKIAWNSTRYLERHGIPKGMSQRKYMKGVRVFCAE